MLSKNELQMTRKRMHETLRVPLQCEKSVMLGFIMCIISFFFWVTHMPIVSIRCLFCFVFTPHKLRAADVFMTTQLIVFAACQFLLRRILSVTSLYHVLRGQDFVKIYGLYIILNLVDRCFALAAIDSYFSLFASALGFTKYLRYLFPQLPSPLVKPAPHRNLSTLALQTVTRAVRSAYRTFLDITSNSEERRDLPAPPEIGSDITLVSVSSDSSEALSPSLSTNDTGSAQSDASHRFRAVEYSHLPERDGNLQALRQNVPQDNPFITRVCEAHTTPPKALDSADDDAMNLSHVHSCAKKKRRFRKGARRQKGRRGAPLVPDDSSSLHRHSMSYGTLGHEACNCGPRNSASSKLEHIFLARESSAIADDYSCNLRECALRQEQLRNNTENSDQKQQSTPPTTDVIAPSSLLTDHSNGALRSSMADFCMSFVDLPMGEFCAEKIHDLLETMGRHLSPKLTLVSTIRRWMSSIARSPKVTLRILQRSFAFYTVRISDNLLPERGFRGPPNTSKTLHRRKLFAYLSCLASDFAICCIVSSLHCFIMVIHYVILVTLLTIPGYSLMPLLLSLNFTKFKAAVFKKFPPELYMQVVLSDVYERIYLLIQLGLVCTHTVSRFAEIKLGSYKAISAAIFQSSADISGYFTSDVNIYAAMNQLTAFCIIASVFLTETLVDWVKHIFLTRTNAKGVEYMHPYIRDVLSSDIRHTSHDVVQYIFATSARFGLPHISFFLMFQLCSRSSYLETLSSVTTASRHVVFILHRIVCFVLTSYIIPPVRVFVRWVVLANANIRDVATKYMPPLDMVPSWLKPVLEMLVLFLLTFAHFVSDLIFSAFFSLRLCILAVIPSSQSFVWTYVVRNSFISGAVIIGAIQLVMWRYLRFLALRRSTSNRKYKSLLSIHRFDVLTKFSFQCEYR